MAKRTASEADEVSAASAALDSTRGAASAGGSAPAAGTTAAAAAAGGGGLVSGEELAAFAETLAQFTPTIPDDVIRHYMLKNGIEATDSRVCVTCGVHYTQGGGKR